MSRVELGMNGKYGLALSIALAFTPACNGTSTGNPMDGAGGKPPTPEGAKLLKSELVREVDPVVSAGDRATLGAGNREFAFELYRELAPTPMPRNLFFSPFSISVALAMLYPGAKETTEAAMRETLHFELPEPALHAAFNGALQDLARRKDQLAEDSTGSGFELSIVNQAWGERGYPFRDGYLDVLARNYGAGLFAVDFGDSEPTRQLINEWVEDQTQSRVKELLPPGALTVDTRLVLTNAIYFKANWLLQFKPEATDPGVFHAPGGDRAVSMMHGDFIADYAEGPSYRALALPYLSPAVRMLLILPAAGDLETLAPNLNGAFFDEVRGALAEHEVKVSLPKFQFESENPLKGPLGELGMSEAFGGDAHFEDIAGGVEPLWIDQVYHKAFVALDEEGTEAAAATAVVVTTESAKPRAEIAFDRPFVFAIYDVPTGEVLFLGHLLDPG